MASGAGFQVASFEDFASMVASMGPQAPVALFLSLEDAKPDEISNVIQAIRNAQGGEQSKILALHNDWEKMKVRMTARSAGCTDVLPMPPTEDQFRQALGMPPLSGPGKDAATQPSPVQGAAGTDPSAQQAKTVLVVDDASIIRTGLKYILTEMGIKVLEASNGNEAYNIFLSSPPDMLITDLIMPGMDGFALMSRFRGNPATSKRPIIVVSSYGDKPRLVKALRSGANDFIVKPFRPEVVKDKVRRHLKLS
jgi:CheY-like chemotaxis protein